MADVENTPTPVPLEVPSASTIPIDITEPAKTDAEGDVSINDGEDSSEAQALAQGRCNSTFSSLHGY